MTSAFTKAFLYIMDGRYDEARALLDKSFANHPFDPDAAALLRELEATVAAGAP